MADADHEAPWRFEFEKAGYKDTRQAISSQRSHISEAKHHFAIRWLRDKEIERGLKQVSWATVVFAFIGAIAFLQPLILHH